MTTLTELIPSNARSPGLSSEELRFAQEAAGAAFPPDLCALLSETLPIGTQWPNWRDRPAQAMRAWREFVIDGFLFDVRENGFWLAEWGDRPTDIEEIGELVRAMLDAAPALIPVFGHRAIPNDPPESGNPVFSVVQTDVIIYGANLREYLINEFHTRPRGGAAVVHSVDVRAVRFWSSL